MRAVLLTLAVLLGLAAAAGLGYWAWYELKPPGPTGILQGADYVPPPPDSTAPPPEPEPAAGIVERLPRGRGRAQGTSQRVRTRTGFGRGVEGRGAMRWLDGTKSVVFDVDAGLSATVEASVERGRLRLYLRDATPGAGERYVWAEARPGAPLRLSGRLATGTTGFFFYAESVGGRTEGVRWAIRVGG